MIDLKKEDKASMQDPQDPEVAKDLLKTAIHVEEWGKRGDTGTIMFYAFKGKDPGVKAEAIGYLAYMIEYFERHNITKGDIARIENEIPNWLKDKSQEIREVAQKVANIIKVRNLS